MTTSLPMCFPVAFLSLHLLPFHFYISIAGAPTKELPLEKHVCEMFTPLNPILNSKTGVYRVIPFFLIFSRKHNILWVLVVSKHAFPPTGFAVAWLGCS